MINRKEIGVDALSKQNEDYDWRQFQDGVWWASHHQEMLDGAISRGMIRTGLIAKHPIIQVFIKCMAYQRWGLMKGFRWAMKNIDSDIVKIARQYDRDQWTYFGSKNLPKEIKFKDLGTGHVEY